MFGLFGLYLSPNTVKCMFILIEKKQAELKRIYLTTKEVPVGPALVVDSL